MSSAPRPATRQIAIVGAGASGVILAHTLLSQDADIRVTLLERDAQPGKGLAYSTTDPRHLLNAPARSMSAVAGEADHFHEWLVDRGVSGPEPLFAQRQLYGDYLAELLQELLCQHQTTGRLRLIRAEVIDVRRGATAKELLLDDGTCLAAHDVVLATGHVGRRLDVEADMPPPRSDVLIRGTGLSMVDTWLTLRRLGHQGRIIAVSRRGLLPESHRPSKPLVLDLADVPLGTSLTYFMRWLRSLIASVERQGGGWRDVVTGLRPHTQAIWHSWPESTRRRFLEHTRAWWDVHRHRVAPSIHRSVREALRTGDLEVVAGRLVRHAASDDKIAVEIQVRHTGSTKRYLVSRIYDCRGSAWVDHSKSHPLTERLLANGRVRRDALGLGIDVSPDCAVLDTQGRPTPGLHAIGPISRAGFFEIESIPEIRAQCVQLAERLTETQRAAPLRKRA